MLSFLNRILLVNLFLLMPGFAVQAAAPRINAAGDPLPKGASARLRSTAFRPPGFQDHGIPLSFAALSPDGKRLVLDPDYKHLVVLDTETGRELRQFPMKPGLRALNFTFSPDGKMLAVDILQEVLLFDIATGKQLARWETPGPIEGRSLVFSADGRRLAMAKTGGNGPKRAAPIWDVASRKKIAALEIMHTYRPRVALAADGKLLASWGGVLDDRPNARTVQLNNIVQLWDVDAGKMLRQIECESLIVSAADLAPDGKRLATVDRNGTTVSIWDTATGALLRQFAARHESNALLRFFPDGKRLMACDFFGVAQVWDVASGKRLGIYSSPKCRPVASAALGNGQMLLAGFDDQTVHIWEVPSRRRRSPSDGHISSVRTVAFSRDGRTIVSAAFDGVCVWDAITGKLLRHDPHRELFLGRDRFHMRRECECGYLLSPDGRFLIDRASTDSARVLDRASGEEICALAAVGTYRGQGEAIPAAFAADSRTFASIGWIDRKGILETRLRIWDLGTGQEIRTLQAFTDRVYEPSVALSPDGKIVACGCNIPARGNNPLRHHIGLWNVVSGKEVCKIDSRGGVILTMAFSPDGAALATAGRDEPVRLWDAADGGELGALEEQPKVIVTNVAFSPDGRLVAAALTDQERKSGKVLLWERITGRLRAEFVGHRGVVFSLAFSPDGRTLASGSADATVLLWDLTGRSEETIANAGPVSDKERTKLWSDLNDADARKAYRAMARLSAEPKQTVELLRQNIRPAVGKPLDVKAIRRARPPAELIRPLRAVELLERLGTAEARKLLETLSGGDPDSPLTRDARTALHRFSEPRPSEPRP